MAKKSFLDTLADGYEDDVLDTLIPHKKKASTSKRAAGGGGRRKKRFIDSMSENLPDPPAKKGKSLLETMEEAHDNNVFDDLFPRRRNRNQSREFQKLESRFSTMITTDVLKRAQQIAEARGIRVKDVINAALKIYVEKEMDE